MSYITIINHCTINRIKSYIDGNVGLFCPAFRFAFGNKIVYSHLWAHIYLKLASPLYYKDTNGTIISVTVYCTCALYGYSDGSDEVIIATRTVSRGEDAAVKSSIAEPSPFFCNTYNYTSSIWECHKQFRLTVVFGKNWAYDIKKIIVLGK